MYMFNNLLFYNSQKYICCFFLFICKIYLKCVCFLQKYFLMSNRTKKKV